jgi:hypothetical protein
VFLRKWWQISVVAAVAAMAAVAAATPAASSGVTTWAAASAWSLFIAVSFSASEAVEGSTFSKTFDPFWTVIVMVLADILTEELAGKNGRAIVVIYYYIIIIIQFLSII